MADGTTLNLATVAGGDKIHTDDITDNGVAHGSKVQGVKLGVGEDGEFRAVGEANPIPISFPAEGRDAFGRLRVSNPTTTFDAQLQYDKQPLLWESSLTGSATDTHDPNASSTIMAVTAATGDKVIRQTRRYQRYQPGKSQVIMVTGVFGPQVAGVRKRKGYFDANDGIYFEEEIDGSLSFNLRSSTSGTPITARNTQGNWHLDNFDGSGPSGITLDAEKAEFLFVDLAWLSVGQVRVGFKIGGRLHYAHTFDTSNIASGPYMKTANLPVRYEIENITGANAGSMRAICSSVVSEGGFTTDLGFQFRATNGVVLKSIGAVETAVLSIRPKALFNGIVNRALIVPESVSAYAADKAGYFSLIYGATLGGTPVWQSANAASMVEFDVAATTVSGGIPIGGDFVDKKGNFTLPSDVLYPLTLDIVGAHPVAPYTDNLTLTFTSGSTSTGTTSTFVWKEVR